MRAVGADVISDLADMCVGWELNADGVVRGKHFSSQFQDPTLVCPSMPGSKYRTTLVRDGGRWLVVELCERLDTRCRRSSLTLKSHPKPWASVC